MAGEAGIAIEFTFPFLSLGISQRKPSAQGGPVVQGRRAELVKLRYFAGLSFNECAALLGVSAPTAKRDWAYSRAWLHHAIGGG